jgi:hypothetical protein
MSRRRYAESGCVVFVARSAKESLETGVEGFAAMMRKEGRDFDGRGINCRLDGEEELAARDR